MQKHDDVAAEVRAHLARRRISGRRLAAQLGMTEPYLSRRLTGAVPFNVNDLSAIADYLELPVASFFDAPEGARMILGVRTTPSRTPILAAAA
jgi:transcriptional regulator with XRE-family HTH domain